LRHRCAIKTGIAPPENGTYTIDQADLDTYVNVSGDFLRELTRQRLCLTSCRLRGELAARTREIPPRPVETCGL
jgi:hypothetical protein